ILKCLEKDSGLRYQAAKELWVDLHRLSAPTSAPSTVTPPRRGKRRLAWGIAIAAAVALVALIALLLIPKSDWHFFVGVANPGKIQALAVLPLNNLSADPAQEDFADRMNGYQKRALTQHK